jgi:UDP-3-O-acyl-N-acetylglucosamine deacetylase
MKFLQTDGFEIASTRGFWLRRKVRVLKTRSSVRGGALANTRILDEVGDRLKEAGSALSRQPVTISVVIDISRTNASRTGECDSAR